MCTSACRVGHVPEHGKKPMPKKLGGRMGPQPLRDAENLLGFPFLQGADLMKVTLANALYKSAIGILKLCFLLRCLVSVENPGRSWIWPLLAFLVNQTADEAFIAWYSGLESVYFDACAHGSSRNKRTKLLATEGLFTDLAQNCPGDHQHASWQPFKGESGVIFPTAMEAEYPPVLCDRMAQCVMRQAQSLGVQPVIQPRLKELLNLTLGQQTLRHAPLIPEYMDMVFLDQPSSNEAYKLLAAPFSQGQDTTEPASVAAERASSAAEQVEHVDKKPRGMFKYGVWHTPEQFLEKAASVIHPMDDEFYLHEVTRQAVKKVVSSDPVDLARERLATVFNLRRLSNELALEDSAIKQAMHPDVKRCTEGKNVALFGHLLQQFGYWDMGVLDLLKFGVPLVGLQPAPKGFKEQLVPATMTEEELLSSALWRRKTMMCQQKRFAAEEEQALIETTSDEVSRGFLQGPYTEQEMSVLQETEGWSLNPRFALFQGTTGKIRVIDDAKRSAVNSAYSATVKLQLQDIDYAANMVLLAMKEAEALGIPVDQWMGKTFDLSKAYKQLAILPEHQCHAVVGFPVGGTWQFFSAVWHCPLDVLAAFMALCGSRKPYGSSFPSS